MDFVTIYFVILVLARRVTLAKSKLQFSRSDETFTFRSLYNLSQADCRAACSARPACVSVDYNRMSKSCDLNKMATGTQTGGLLKKRKGVVHSKKSDWAQNISGSCQCAIGQTCNITNSSCAIEECDPLRPQTKSNMLHIGAKSDVSINCLRDGQDFHDFGAGLEPATHRSTLTCGTDGSWALTPPPGANCHVVAFVIVPGTQQDPYYEWVHGNSSRFGPGPSWNKPYRGDVIDYWHHLPITHVRFSVFKNNTEVQYVVFYATGASNTSWFTQSRVIRSSWQDLATLPNNLFSIYGDPVRVIRRFYMNVSYGGCDVDVGWFMVVVRAVCYWEIVPAEAYPLLLYSTLDSAGVVTSYAERADYVYVTFCIGTC